MNSKRKSITLALSMAAACWLGAALARDSASQPEGKTQAPAPKSEAAKAAPVQQQSETEMMEAWAKFCGRPFKETGKVVAFRRAK